MRLSGGELNGAGMGARVPGEDGQSGDVAVAGMDASSVRAASTMDRVEVHGAKALDEDDHAHSTHTLAKDGAGGVRELPKVIHGTEHLTHGGEKHQIPAPEWDQDHQHTGLLCAHLDSIRTRVHNHSPDPLPTLDHLEGEDATTDQDTNVVGEMEPPHTLFDHSYVHPGHPPLLLPAGPQDLLPRPPLHNPRLLRSAPQADLSENALPPWLNQTRTLMGEWPSATLSMSMCPSWVAQKAWIPMLRDRFAD